MATILIVDDRASNRQFLLTLLGYGKHQLIEAANGVQALELVRARRPDLVITDILMPQMDGYEFVQQLRSDPEVASTTVIFYTATYSAPEARALANSCGVEIVLPKPCEPQQILAAVNKALRIEVVSSETTVAASKAVLEAGRLIDVTGSRYAKDLQAVKLGFDEVIEHSGKLIAQRDLARGLSKKLAANVESMQRIMSRLSALIEVGMEMEAERDPARLVELFFAAACDVIDSTYAAVAVLDEQDLVLRHVYAKGIDAGLFRAGADVRAGILGSLLSGHRAMRARSPGQGAGSEGLPAGHPPVRNILALPVASAARIYGWLYFADKSQATEFSAEDERLASIMASKLGLLYENVNLYDAIQKHAAKLQLEVVERRRAQDALTESESGLKRAQAMANLAHVVSGPNGEFLSWSHTLPRLAGLDEAAMPSSTREWLELIHPEDRERFRQCAVEAARSGARTEAEYRLRRGGEWIHLRQALEPHGEQVHPDGPRRWFNTIQDVSERYRADEELRRFRLAMDNSADMIIIIDRSTLRNVDVNNTACRLLGYSKEELLGMGPQDYLPGSRADFEKAYDALIADPARASGMNSSYRCKDGSRLPFESTRHVLRSGDTWLIAVISRDIRQRIAAENALRESEAGLRRAQSMARLAHVVVGIDGRYEGNPASIGDLLGLPSGEAPRQLEEFLRYAHPDDLERVRITVSEAVQSRKDYRVEYRVVRADGQVAHLRQEVEWISNPDGSTPTRRFATLQDVTEQKRNERDLEQFRFAMDMSLDTVYLTDVEALKFIYVNETACGRLGYSRADLLNMGPHDVLRADRETIRGQYRAVMTAGDAGVTSESSYLRSDGSEGWTEITRRGVQAISGPVVVTIGRDITERKRAEAELRVSEARFRSLTQLSSDWYWEQDEEYRFVEFTGGNSVAGWGPDQHSAIGLRRWELPGGSPASGSWADHEAVVQARKPFRNFEYMHTRLDGTRQYIAASGEPVFDAGGRFKGYRGVATNIAGRKQAEERIRRLNRVYAVLSGINGAIVRIRDREELFREACRIAVEHGEFKVAMIAMVERESRQLRPVALSGADAGFLAELQARSTLRDDAPEGMSIGGHSIRNKAAVVVNDVANDARILNRNACTKRGIFAIASLPLLIADEAVGVLALFAGETGYFDDDELKLLHELAGDIAFALDSIEKREKVDYLAFYDQLTGLANRTLFHERVTQKLDAAQKSGLKIAVVIAEIERLRMINDSLGRQAGDALLQKMAERLARGAGQAEVARIGGDNFAVILPEAKGRSEIGRKVDALWHNCLDEPLQLGNTEIRVAMKGGIALFPNDGQNADALFQNAEAAWKKAKQTGERYLFHAPEMTARIAENLALENKLRQALEKEEFVLHYQPKVDIETRRISGVEALIRWQSPERGLVPPGLFIPLLEETGLILQVGVWALQRAADDHGKWLQLGVPAPRIAVNVSSIQLRQRDFVAVVKEAIAGGANPTGIDIEITESLLMEDVEGNIRKLTALRDLGMKISIDDFGTGYSSLGYLAKLPVHTLKIDRSFIITMLDDPNTMTLVSTMISLAHSLRLNVVAEGVEKEEQAKMLRLLRCDLMQGYLFSKPLPLDGITALLRERT